MLLFSNNIKYNFIQILIYALVYFPQICNTNTEAIKIKLMTKTGTGPLLSKNKMS